MLKLVFHTASFGPFNFEFFKPYVRVGRQPDNDLVLPHASVRPYHCIIAFREDTLVVLPPEFPLGAEVDPQSWNGPAFHAGDKLRVGELELAIELSRNTVAIPQLPSASAQSVLRQAWPLPASTAEAAAVPSRETIEPLPEGPLYLCAQCQLVFADAAVTRIGLVGHGKHLLCPQCSYPVEPYQETRPQAAGVVETFRRSWSRFKQWLMNLGSR